LKRFFLTLLSIITFTFAVNAKDPLLFVISHPGSKPYLYYNESKKVYEGIIPDILEELINSSEINVKFISNNRQRSEEYMYSGNADLMMLSKSWLSKPEQLIATVPILQHRSFLYQSKPFSENFLLDNAPKKATVCTREGFRYPNLDKHFKNKTLVRVDSSSQLYMLKMLFKERCDFTIMNEYVAMNLVNSPFFEDEEIYPSPAPISSVPINIILRPTLVKEKQLLDEHILALQKSGEFEQIIQKHLSSRHKK